MSVEAKNVGFSYGGDPVLRGVSFRIGEGELVAVLGPNGVGKSTLFGCVLGFLKPTEGSVELFGRDVRALSRRELARCVSYIPQSATLIYNYTVLDMVTMGLAGQIGIFRTPSAEHKAQAMEALESLGIAHLADRGCNRISGGERQLMLLARALTQQARVLVMDEPTANLDYGNAFRVMERVRSLAGQGFTVLFSTHEPNHAFRYADRVLALKGGEVLADGAPEKALTEETLSALYGVDVAVRTARVGDEELSLSIPYRGGAEQ